jgi:DNA-3-methyladenine glycosylase
VVGPEFFARPSDIVAPDLIGKILWREGRGGGRLVEVEAYLPTDDPACHAAGGRTTRNSAMFGPPGTIYVFLSYGVHYLVNLVCDAQDVGSAVLVRALSPLTQAGLSDPRATAIGGPGLVGRSLGVGPESNGRPLGPDSGLVVIDDGMRPVVGATTRVGISKGADLALRYYMVGSRCVSRMGQRRRGSTI